MTGAEEVELFSVLARSSRFKEWLDQHEASAVKDMKNVQDLHKLGKAQGKVAFVDEMKALLEKGKQK